MKTDSLITKVSILFSLIIVVLLSFFLDSCKKEAPADPNNNPFSDINTSPGPHDYAFDLDGDGRIDYRFAYCEWITNSYPNPSYGMGLSIESRDSNQVQNSSFNKAVPIPDSVVISDSSGWGKASGSFGGISSSTPWHGPWVGSCPNNLGLRLNRNGLYYYGWVKFYLDSTNGVLNIIDSAYCTTANTPILAGIHP